MHIMLCRNQSEMSHTCRGTINLANSLIQPGDSCNIVISHGGTRTFHLKATSEVERQRWVTSLELSKARAISIAESGIVIAVCICGTSLRVGALLVTTTTTNYLCFIDHFQMNLSQHGTGTRSLCCFTILHNLGLLVSPFFFLHFCFRIETFEIGDTSFSQARCSSGHPAKISEPWRQLGAVASHTHPFNGPLSRTTRVSRYQKGTSNLDFTEARDSEWQWHQLGHMQVCTSLQTDNHASTPPLKFFYRPYALPAAQPTASKHWRQWLQREEIAKSTVDVGNSFLLCNAMLAWLMLLS